MFIVPTIAIRTIETHNIAMAINFLRNFLSILSPAHFFYFMFYIHWVQWTFRCFICQYKIFPLIISIFVIFQYLSISFISIIRIVYQAKMLPQNYIAIFLLNRKIGTINELRLLETNRKARKKYKTDYEWRHRNEQL